MRSQGSVVQINWLLFDKKRNPKTTVLPIDILQEDTTKTLRSLLPRLKEEIYCLFRRYRVELGTIEFYTVRHTSRVTLISSESESLFVQPKTDLPIKLPRDWMSSVVNIDDVGEFQPLPSIIDTVVAQINSKTSVHLLVTAEEEVEEEEGHEERDVVKKLPQGIHMYHYGQSSSSSPYYVIASRRHTLTTLMSSTEFDIMLRDKKATKAPSKTAISSKYAEIQKNPFIAIRDGSFVPSTKGTPIVLTLAPPVELYHPVFDQFLRDMADPSLLPEHGIVPLVRKLTSQAAGIYSKESELSKLLRECLTALLRVNLAQVLVDEKESADSMGVKELDGISVPLMLSEHKRSIGEGNCDVTRQAGLSLLNWWKQSDVGVCH